MHLEVGVIVIPNEVAVKYFQIVLAYNIVTSPKFGPSYSFTLENEMMMC